MRYRQVIIVFFRALLIILILGLFCVQIIRGNYFYNLSKRNITRVVPLEAARGRILDRNGVVIADSVASFDLFIIPQEIKNKPLLFSKLSDFLGISLQAIDQIYKKNYINPFVPIKIYEKLDKDRLIMFEENKIDFPGVIVEIQPKRFYPYRSVASHLLGYLSQIDIWRITKLEPYGYELTDLVGYSGVEEYYDLVLRGQKGGEQVEVDNLGQRVRTIGYKPQIPGQDIQITIDMRIQEIVDKFMKGKRGAVIIIDPYSGEIISLSSHPNYDPNDFISKKENIINDLLKDKDAPLFNRAISGQFPAGSIFKIVTSSAALEKSDSIVNRSFICEGNFRIGNRSFNCWSVHAEENLRDAFIHSCNIYFYNLGILTGPEEIHKYAVNFGLSKSTGIDLNYEAKGFIPSPKWRKIIKFQEWRKGDTANISIGQGEILVTPIQMVRMASIFINGGQLVQPHLIKSIEARKVNIGKNKKVKLNKDTLEKINGFMYEVINDPEGTAHIAEIKGLKIYGKTGTAQVSGKKAHGWFIGFVGRDKPKYAFCIFLENAGAGYLACLMAKDIFKQMLDRELI